MAELKNLLVTGKTRLIEHLSGLTATFSGNVTAPNFIGNLQGKATSATSADVAAKLTSNTWGGGTKLWYLSSGTPTNSTSNVGSGVKPIYLSNGVVTASGSTVGSATLPVYLNAGTITNCSTTLGVNITGNAAYATNAGTAAKLGSVDIGGTAKPIWIDNGTAKAISSTVGSSTKPVYLNAGTITVCGSSLAVNISGTAANATYATNAGYATNAAYATNAGTAAKLGTTDVGGTAKPIWLDNGTATACNATVGNAARPVYMSGGTITVCTGNIGNSTRPVYMANGTLTMCGTSLGVSITGSANKATYDSAGSNIAAKWANYLPLAGGIMTGAIAYSSYTKTGMVRNTVGSFDIQSTNASVDTKISLVSGSTTANYASMSYNDSEKCIEFLFS